MVEREDPALVKVRGGSGQLRLGRVERPPLPRPELLDVVDRFDVDDHPGLLEVVRRTEREPNAQAQSGPAGAAAGGTDDVSDKLAPSTGSPS